MTSLAITSTPAAAAANNNNHDNDGLLPRRTVIYCGACGMPPEYCEYGPDFETDCDPWLRQHHPELWAELAARRGPPKTSSSKSTQKKTDLEANTTAVSKPSRPWTTQERLVAFYQKYVPDKIDAVPALLEKYAGKEEKLFQALVTKYGPEPLDPYFSDEDDDDDDDEDEEEEGEAGGDAAPAVDKKSRRGVGAKKADGTAKVPTRVVVQKQAQKKKRNLTVVFGLETVPQLKLKEVSKVFSKAFAGSSSVQKDYSVLVQGDHVLEVAELLVDKFQVPETALFLDMDGEVVPFR